MCAIAKLPTRFFLLFVVTLSLTACLSGVNHGPKPPSEEVVKARQAIANNREAATVLVPRIKERFKGKESEQDYVKARALYDEAMIQNNSWLTSLKLGIENNEDLEHSKAFKDKATAAAEATDAFVKYGKQLTQKKFSASVIPAVVIDDLVKMLIENGIVLWKTYRAEELAARLDQAARTEKELKWVRWEHLDETSP